MGKNKAQVTIEYALLIALIVAAVVLMTPYVTRGWNSIVRGASDALVLNNCDPKLSPVPCENLTQYMPYYQADKREVSSAQSLTEGYDKGTTKVTADNTITEVAGSLRKTGVDRTQDDAWLK
ncbi:MAG: class III signal peptide-containing protein [Candidatus Omnitrophica bacterium]|nr:class III signal peptide-containing protein [Candidatus Omnitrophota bacterium]